MMDVQFHRSMREDVTVTFVRPVDDRAVEELAHLPGVHRAEGIRSVPARFRAGHLWRDAALNGYAPDAELRQLVDLQAERHVVPSDGVLLTTKLGEVLNLSVGDQVRVELREGDWRTTHVTVAGFVDESFGLQGHMQQDALARLMGDAGAINTVLLAVDPLEHEAVERRLKSIPLVASVSSPHDLKKAFNEQSAAMMSLFTFIITIFAAIIAIGVIYNNARVALSQRTRDLASMRVLGFTQREIAAVLFGEQTIQVVIAIPIGLWLGNWLSNAMMSQVDPEMYRFTIMISTRTYLYAVAVTLLAAIASAFILRRKIQRLDLIGVLKTRE
jgi:putative ABC transport system permease protein